MRKLIFILTFLCCLNLVYANSRFDNTKYPFALLTDDYGILSPEDLAINSCDVDPVVFSQDSHSYPYWQCFPVKEIEFACDPAGIDGETKNETALLMITISEPKGQQRYVPRRAMEMSNCQWFQKRWKKGIRKQQFACLSGSFSGFENEGGYQISNWVFDKFKTKRLCASYFYGGCSWNYAKKNGCGI